MQEIMNLDGPVFVAIKTKPEIENLPMALRKDHYSRSISETINDLRSELNIK